MNMVVFVRRHAWELVGGHHVLVGGRRTQAARRGSAFVLPTALWERITLAGCSLAASCRC